MKPDSPDASPPSERFLTRWSRLKRTGALPAEAAPTSPPSAAASPGSVPAAGAPDAAAAHAEAAASLPPIESLSIESDFAPFFQPKVPEALRRAAVKKLFADPRFNVMDGLDVYIDDYSKADPIPPEMLKMLNHARDLIDHPSNRIEREQAAAAGDGTAPDTGIDESAAAESTSGTTAATESTSDTTAAELKAPPAVAHRADDTLEPAEAAAQSKVTTGRPADAG